MNKKAFLLTDCLIAITILMAISSLLFSLYFIINKQDIVYKNYIERNNKEIDYIYSLDNYCEACHINE